MSDAANEIDERYHALADSLDTIVFITDMNIRMRYANPALTHRTGFTAADFQFAQDDNPFIHRDDAARVTAFLAAFISGEARRSTPIENRFLDRWGRSHRVTSVITKVRYDGAPALQFVCRPLVEAGAAPSPGEREYLALIEAADDAILRLDSAGRILFANHRTETLTGLDRVGLGKASFVELLAEGDRDAVRARLIDAARATHRDERVAAQLVSAGGETRDIEVTVGSLAPFGADGEWLAIVRDVTRERAAAAEHARLEQQLRDAQKLETVGGLAAGIAHDFNNLLAAVMTNVGLARSGIGVPQRLDDIQRAAERAASLCRQILAYTGKAPLRVDTVDLHALVDDLAEIIGAALSGRGRLRRARDDRSARVTGDPAQLQQLVMSLAVNAADALGERGGEVVLETAARDDVVVLRVTDDGAGMDEATRARMFDPYFTTKGMGRGLGLAGVLGIVRGHHGTIDVETAPGRGTTVEVRLPAAAPAAIAVPPPPTDDLASWRGHGAIVVADDEKAVRAAIAMVLADVGFEVVEAGDGVEALAAAERTPAAVALIFDVTMPNLGGIEALRRLRAAGNRVPAIVISGYQETALTPATSAALRPVRFLGKPFELDELLAAVRAAIE